MVGESGRGGGGRIVVERDIFIVDVFNLFRQYVFKAIDVLRSVDVTLQCALFLGKKTGRRSSESIAQKRCAKAYYR